jgi:Tannase-like family of unknown function (DUF6351)
VLVEVDGPADSNWRVYLDRRDISASFHSSERSGALLALLDGLRMGKSTLELRVAGSVKARLQLVNHPIAGPIISGPHQEPFLCQTEANGLGPALDADCSAKTVVQYYYKSTEPPQMSERDKLIVQIDALFKPGIMPLGFKLYDPSGPRPSDIAQVTLPDGSAVNFIVRREIGVINRAVYAIQFLHEPNQPLSTPWSRAQAGWNGRLVYAFGGGCSAGYRQGILPPDYGTADLKDVEALLAQGYALAGSSLNVLGNTCDDKVSAETASMVKEYFVKKYGEPAYTIGMGGSGGAVSVYLIAQNYPGILDGIIAFLSAPDIISTVIPVFSDCALLDHALEGSKYSWTVQQKTAISGFTAWQICSAGAQVLNGLGLLSPRTCPSSLPKELIYDPSSNPHGTRCTFYDNEVNVFGRDPKTGFARRTLDNVGVQYGLVAFNAGKIDAEQFTELNERMGGFDDDGQITSNRTVADPEALRVAYQYGVLVYGKSLGDIPIIDWNRYLDEAGGGWAFHTRDRAFITRERLISANGDAGNQVILVTPRPTYDGLTVFDIAEMPGVGLTALVPAMDRWLANIAADHQRISAHEKTVRDRPADLADGCIAPDSERIAESATYDGSGRCNELYPNHGNPRVVAGASIAGDILKCALKPVDPSDYSRPLTPDQLKRLKTLFAAGVCDYSRPGVGEDVKPIIWHELQ